MYRMQRLPQLRLLVCFCVASLLTQAGLAQSTQHGQTDLDFVNRMSSQADNLTGRLDILYGATGYQRSGRSASSSGGSGFGIDHSGAGGYSSDGSSNRGITPGTSASTRPGASSISEDDLSRINRKLLSIKRKIDSQRKKLSSDEPMTEKQLSKSEKAMQNVERDLKSLETQITDMERVLL